MVVAVGMVY